MPVMSVISENPVPVPNQAIHVGLPSWKWMPFRNHIFIPQFYHKCNEKSILGFEYNINKTKINDSSLREGRHRSKS